VVAAALVECEAEGVVEWLTAGAVALVAGAELADPDPEAPAPAHSVCWSCRAVACSSAVQFAVRHAPAAVWKAMLVHTQVRSWKEVQPAEAAAVVTQSRMQGEIVGGAPVVGPPGGAVSVPVAAPVSVVLVS